jgi:hypothetical protein
MLNEANQINKFTLSVRTFVIPVYYVSDSPLRTVILLRFRIRYGKKLRFRLRNTADDFNIFLRLGYGSRHTAQKKDPDKGILLNQAPDALKLIQIITSLTPIRILIGSIVTDPGCLSRIPDPNFSIADLGSRVKKISDPIKEFKYF